MANKRQNQNFNDPETEEVISTQEEKVEEPKKFQNEGKKLFSTKKEGGTRAN